MEIVFRNPVSHRNNLITNKLRIFSKGPKQPSTPIFPVISPSASARSACSAGQEKCRSLRRHNFGTIAITLVMYSVWFTFKITCVLSAFSLVEVGTPVARCPPHGSRRAILSHRDLRTGTQFSPAGRLVRSIPSFVRSWLPVPASPIRPCLCVVPAHRLPHTFTQESDSLP